MITIYGLVDPREPDHIRYIGAVEGTPDLEKCCSLDLMIQNKDRRHWLLNLKSEGISPKIKIIQKTVNDLYYGLRTQISKHYEQGHKLFNAKLWVMSKQPNKIDEVRITIMMRKLRSLYPDKKFIAQFNGVDWWSIMCNDFDFYMKDKKFKVWKDIFRKKNKSFVFIFCYCSKADKTLEELRKQYKDYKFI